MQARLFRRRDQRGASAVEYSLVAALIAAVVVFAVLLFGNNTNGLYRCTGGSIAVQESQC